MRLWSHRVTYWKNKIRYKQLKKSKSLDFKNRKLSFRGENQHTWVLPYCKNYKANNPERPVISSIYCHTSRTSNFVDYYLKPAVKKLKSYVKDTADFIKKS